MFIKVMKKLSRWLELFFASAMPNGCGSGPQLLSSPRELIRGLHNVVVQERLWPRVMLRLYYVNKCNLFSFWIY